MIDRAEGIRDRRSERRTKIAELGPEHAKALLDFYTSLSDAVTALFLPFNSVTLETLRRHLEGAEEKRHISLGLVADDCSIEGHAFITDIDTARPTLGIGVRDHLIGHGWGTTLMGALLAEADSRGLPLVTLTVVKANARALALYLKVGFLIRGEATFRRPNDSWYMERRSE